MERLNKCVNADNKPMIMENFIILLPIKKKKQIFVMFRKKNL